MSNADTWETVKSELREVSLLYGAQASLAWDQQCYMPPGAAALRGEQMALLSRLVHERLTSPKLGRALEDLDGHVDDATTQRAVELLRKDYDRTVKLPADLVERRARAGATGFDAWIRAKEASDFAIFAPHLQEHLDLAKETAAAIDPEGHPLQVLMDGFDPGVSIEALRTAFSRLQTGLSELIEAAGDAEDRTLGGTWPTDGQLAMHRKVAERLGYDFDTGRMDLAEHPFTISLGHQDVRITTHVYDDDLLGGLGGTVHETGHALYEQGLPRALFGTGLDQAASFGLHESQSRFWENAIGRSRPFFEWMKPLLDSTFPGHPATVDSLYRAANRIQPGPNRVKADEVTYNLHIIVRVELELALFEGRLEVADLPDAWNEKYTKYLGITPPDDAEGVLQDVHWSGGSFAYFQSYTLGNLYAAAFHAVLREQMPDLDARVAKGDFAPILGWLRENVHQHGRSLDGTDRVKAVVGQRDYVEDLLAYLWGRHGALYGLTRPR
ncbi:MAG: carboxypeptidase M32 [Myxococcales bacterium]|nr:carboxypeptidase M32 [Myxococcales bacterium]